MEDGKGRRSGGSKRGRSGGSAWDPSKHPRGYRGRFIAKPGGGAGTVDPRKIKRLLNQTFAQKTGEREKTLRVNLGDVGNAATIKKVIGVDISGYSRVIDSGDVRKNLKVHGPQSVAPGTRDVGIVRKDFERIPNIVAGAITHGGGHRKGRLSTLTYVAKLGKYEYYYAETIRTGKKQVALKSLAKKRV